MRDELPHQDLTMMIRTDRVDELQRVTVVTFDGDETSAEHLPINARQVAIVLAKRSTLIFWEIMLPARALFRVVWLLCPENPPELRSRIGARFDLRIFSSLRR